VIREGISVVIAGRPNVGKSSLLNELLQEERALVTEVPGTTRDTIEEMISIHGIPIHLVDTAGIRAHDDLVEELGIERARRKLDEADLVLFLVDAGAGLTDQDRELYGSVAGRDHIVVLNKTDIASPDLLAGLEQSFPGTEVVRISCHRHEGIEGLREAMFRRMQGDGTLEERPACAPNLRHRLVLEKSRTACRRLREAMAGGAPADLLAVEVQAALDHLGDIVGITTPEDVLDAIFSRFCIGK